jgi:solute carrier family 45 protein 1/2/4
VVRVRSLGLHLTVSPLSRLISKSFTSEVRQIFTNMWSLPRVIKQIASCLSRSKSLAYPVLVHHPILVRLWTCVLNEYLTLAFSSWIAWFPLLFYTTMYIGDLHKRAFYAKLSPSLPTPSDADLAALDAEATRLGSRALFFSSLVTLFGNICLPFCVTKQRKATETGMSHSPAYSPQSSSRRGLKCYIPDAVRLSLSSLWAVGQAVYTGCMLGTL